MKTIYPTTSEYPGIWLLPIDALTELDEIIDSMWNDLEIVEKAYVDSEIEDYLKKYNVDNKASVRNKIEERIRDQRKRHIVVHFKDSNKRISASSFSEVKDHPDLLSLIPIGFEMELARGNVSVDFSLQRTLDFRLSVSPQSSEEVIRFFGKIDSWARKNSPNKFFRTWKEIRGFHWFFWAIFIILLSSATVSKNTLSPEKVRAYELLKDGIQVGELNEAVGILLAREVDYTPTSTPINLPPWYKISFFASLLLSIILSFFPSGHRIGLGKGESLVNAWSTWLRLVFLTAPLFLLLTTLSWFLGKLLDGLKF